MLGRQSVIHALKAVGTTLTLSLLAAFILVWANKPAIPLGVALVGYTAALAGPLLGLAFGEMLALELRRDTKKWGEIGVYVAGAAVLLATAYAIGAQTHLMVRGADAAALFPAWCLIGLIAGGISTAPRFRPNRNARQRSSYAVEIKFSEPTNPVDMSRFRAWLHERFGVAPDHEPRVLFQGPRRLRAGIAEINQALQMHSLADNANIIRSEV